MSAEQLPKGEAGRVYYPVACRVGVAELLDRVRAFLCDYVAFPKDEQATIIALWVVLTWVIDAFDCTPYLHISSPTKQCGKSRVLDCLEYLTNKPWKIVTPSPAVLYRKIEQDCPTLLWDEVDTIFTAAKGDDGKEELRAVLNAGFQRGAKVPRCVGPNYQLKEFAVFSPKVLAGIGELPDTVADRSIPIVLARKQRGVSVAKFRLREVAAKTKEIKEALAALSQPEVITRLRDARPDLPDGLSDRAEDIGEPLLAIADLAGGNWPDAARFALVNLCGQGAREDDNPGVKLLLACRDIFAEANFEQLPSRKLLDKLVECEDDAPWAIYWEADLKKGNDRGPARRLARMLKPFGVRPKKIRDEDGPVQGYSKDSFKDAFARYLPGD